MTGLPGSEHLRLVDDDGTQSTICAGRRRLVSVNYAGACRRQRPALCMWPRDAVMHWAATASDGCRVVGGRLRASRCVIGFGLVIVTPARRQMVFRGMCREAGSELEAEFVVSACVATERFGAWNGC